MAALLFVSMRICASSGLAWLCSFRLMAALLFVSMRICASREKDWNDGVDDEVGDVEADAGVDEDAEGCEDDEAGEAEVGDVEADAGVDEDAEGSEDDDEAGEGLGRGGANGGPTHLMARLQHHM
jgi:hypothetical protein